VRVATTTSLISLGTERMLVAFGRANLIQKARQQPEKVRQVLAKVKTDGLLPTVDAVRSKLAQPLPLGYSNVGVVVDVGDDVSGFSPGDRVVSNGPHAEMISTPTNLCAKVPDEVTDESAAFTVVGAIALQGIRLLEPTLGERVAVIGLGLIGLMAVQLLRANGVRVLGADLDPDKCELARRLGADVVGVSGAGDVEAIANEFSEGYGVDGVLVTAATSSSEPMNQAARICRKRGRIIQVGLTGLELSRRELYDKELSVRVSCSYGPGRYDPAYEQRGLDYPIGYVRWTEQRNFQAVLEQLALGRLRTEELTTHRFPIERAHDAYAVVSGGSALGIVLSYAADATALAAKEARQIDLRQSAARSAQPRIVLGVIGAGNFAERTLLPALEHADVEVQCKTIASSGGTSSARLGERFGFERATTDVDAIIGDDEINTILITSRHDAHAKQVLAALAAGKHVFVEKPLCLTSAECDEIEAAARESQGLLMVGFNRRFSPYMVKMRELLQPLKAPMSLVYTVNAGVIPAEHWTQDPSVGGGRIVGEGCHFVDTLRYLTDSRIDQSSVQVLGGAAQRTADVASLSLTFEDGSIGAVHYFANGHADFPKERLEVFCAGRVLELSNFRSLVGRGFSSFSKLKTSRQDKGHRAELRAFLSAVRDGSRAPIPLGELLEVSRVALDLQRRAFGAG
jgi:predicted dehydrogenase